MTEPGAATRFDTRSKLGRELNARLETSEAAFRETVGSISRTRDNFYLQLPAFDVEFNAWVKSRSVLLALHQAAFATLTLTVIFYAASVRFRTFFAGIEGMVLGLPTGNISFGPLVLAVLLSAPTLTVAYLYNKRKLAPLLAKQAVVGWYALYDKWSSSSDFEPYFLNDADHHFGASNEAGNDDSGEQAWHEVLAVRRDASVQEIKEAYRQAVKNYHPDRVSGLGPKLQELAEEETKRFNAAYQEARSLRGF